jgi:ubiquinone/menaquinone biosynthesis C-methylase UbiE
MIEISVSKLWRSLVECGFRLLYNEMAWSYDVVSWIVSMGNWRRWQRTALDYLGGGRVLEVAHGPGHMMVQLQQGGFDVVGMDISRVMVKMAQKRLRRQGLKSRVVRGDARRLPFTPNSFDAVLSTFPTVFIIDQTTPVNFFRVLRPGGRLVIVLLARLTGKGPITRLLEWAYRITGQRPDESERANHIQATFAGLFEQAGFRVSFEQVMDKGSEVTLFIGDKPVDP